MDIKLVTYNIHHGRGLDFKVSVKRIADVLWYENPDLVSINEADQHHIRSFFTNQPKALADLLGMHYFYGPNLKFLFTRYGNLVLSKYRLHYAENIKLPADKEQRGFVKTKLIIEGKQIIFISTHLGLTVEERAKQIACLYEEIKDEKRPLILAGDLNCRSEELTLLCGKLQTAGIVTTYPANNPTHSIDHILCSEHFEIIKTYTLNSLASDHLPLVALLRL